MALPEEGRTKSKISNPQSVLSFNRPAGETEDSGMNAVVPSLLGAASIPLGVKNEAPCFMLLLRASEHRAERGRQSQHLGTRSDSEWEGTGREKAFLWNLGGAL